MIIKLDFQNIISKDKLNKKDLWKDVFQQMKMTMIQDGIN